MISAVGGDRQPAKPGQTKPHSAMAAISWIDLASVFPAVPIGLPAPHNCTLTANGWSVMSGA